MCHRITCPSVEQERTDEIPVEFRVCDYDELDESTKEMLPAMQLTLVFPSTGLSQVDARRAIS